ncbi:tRNAHis guanylyltransferase [Fomitiporia mediterranea MF3/22]|uniref:tRNAHis guanylyltransferase n=1 Tax=Fomitiporia mediterranea (strain MF3/22) TaxID=694068 RepID=UPI00044088B4|nr:tRNAHis guanylyltransferase [Fomitiporia mediterranea MF3/22]EJD06810.1 tRNAHis guanylyltransferase [Fomitiporia mediterranea MF3/22]
MAGTKYAYVRAFERPDPLLPNTFIVCRVDGHAFHRFSDIHGFEKPNDVRGLRLMDTAAYAVMNEYKDIVLGFGESDEYSFLLRRSTQLYNRRESKILTTLVSHFTAAYIFNWHNHFPDTPLQYPPTFDGRIVLYPTSREVRDYFSWRQADTHINNLYNTVFWALVKQGGQTTTEAHATLRGTVSSQKHEILFSRFGINYNNIEPQFRKGSIIVREVNPEASVDPPSSSPTSVTTAAQEAAPDAPMDDASADPSSKYRSAKKRPRSTLRVLHEDLIGDGFWEQRPGLLDD